MWKFAKFHVLCLDAEKLQEMHISMFFAKGEAENQRWLLNGNDELREIWEENEPIEEEEEFGRG